jgi:hypothetical protein
LQLSSPDDDEIEAAAEATRRHWKLDLEAPLAHVGRALERGGVTIIPYHSATSAKVDAFSRFGRTTVSARSLMLASCSD